MKSILAAILIGLTAANFTVAAFRGDWRTAVDRSFHQFAALICVWAVLRKN